jgi:lysophospholipase L1-like esterase
MICRGGRLALLIPILLVTVTIARGELVPANYGGTNLLKIMPVGDSITDDCSINGAWRSYLQPMLETNGLAFTNTGRQVSSFITGFTKRSHEGYCGAVIAAPGYFAAHNYADTDNYLQRIVPDALAITKNRPDLMLILIGANDIGHGRNPRIVATNDMSVLLNAIFSNAPNVNVILTKATTLQNAGLGYNIYATNVPIYNSALQQVVNQRRALGQKVFLADMFSAVDYDTGFLSDHLHPNTLGLQAMAREWATRIETVSIRTNCFTSLLINGGANWKYFDGGQSPGANWMQPDFDDSSWSNGIARLGYGDPTTATTVNFGADSNNKYVTTYFRRSFALPWNAVLTNLNFRLARADGAVVWFNGQEVFRTNMPAGPIDYTNQALATVPAYKTQIFYPKDVPVTNSSPATNLVAVEVHLSVVTNATLGFDLELIGSGNLLPMPTLSITQSVDNVQISWPVTNGGGDFALYSTTNLAAENSWSETAATAQTNGEQMVVTQPLATNTIFFRLQRP